MKTVLGKIRRCDEEYHLFAPGDRVAIGVSGGSVAEDTNVAKAGAAALK